MRFPTVPGDDEDARAAESLLADEKIVRSSQQPGEQRLGEDDAAFPTLRSVGAPVLWIVSSGGHLVQALQLERLIGVAPESTWITNDVLQARSLLAGRRAHFVDYVAPRDLRGALQVAKLSTEVARQLQPRLIASTGAAIAGVALPWLAFRGYKTAFIESLARRTNHSLTGRICAIAPGVTTYTQYHEKAGRRSWRFDGSVLSNWRATTSGSSGSPTDPLRIFVTLGTIRPYRFDRAVARIVELIEPGDQVVWQLGSTTAAGLPGLITEAITSDEMHKWINWADVVITHAGVGSILDVIEAGKAPVVVVREKAHGEHIDDHQADIADEIERRGIGHILDLSSPRRQTLLTARQMRVGPTDA